MDACADADRCSYVIYKPSFCNYADADTDADRPILVISLYLHTHIDQMKVHIGHNYNNPHLRTHIDPYFWGPFFADVDPDTY